MALGTGTKIGIGVVLAGAIAVMVASDPGEGVLEYLYVEQVVQKMASDPKHFADRTIKVHGTVVEGTVKKSKTTGDYRFTVEHGGERIDVHFTNIPPDTFQEGGEVVLIGQFDDSGQVFESDDMNAKCPSKYENEAKAPGGAAPTMPSKS
ncbi:cytochrome c maturation protein CcmE [Paraliomyxa miuraensis]|uniref:cytochrome c maturation protein CcmE n=1 Tax=Paraliomyxa miuraensis TaxID=376150 RepID=UPI00225B2E80|nr:cytochrome c maturation protein CcmE [Paraliomyxa miuraensis]MCX4239850.1 cytochrome c maturation protein CcmE [Paraliomyxa miuraensis]